MRLRSNTCVVGPRELARKKGEAGKMEGRRWEEPFLKDPLPLSNDSEEISSPWKHRAFR